MNPSPPSVDTRWQLVDRVMQRLGHQAEALIETLHVVQDAFGYMDNATLTRIASPLRLPPAKVFDAATFYNHFTLQPKGAHPLSVCAGTACHIKMTW
ncbi:MAG: NAD(P)H-dependent oxidoreductase subunit E [Desulfobulbus sp.]|nr:NAD(P)H-dependent oxidoreductase subunit E [Desulfobulbus sp.]